MRGRGGEGESEISPTLPLSHSPPPDEPRTRRGESHPSRSPESDADFPGFEDDGHLPSAGERDHSLELLLVVLDVDVDERNLPLGVVLTGRYRVGSGVLSENLDGFHLLLPCHLTAKGGQSLLSAASFPRIDGTWML